MGFSFSELAKRISVAIFGIPIILLAIYFGDWFLVSVIGIVQAVALWEFYGLSEKKGFFPLKILGIIWVLTILFFIQTKGMEMVFWIWLIGFLAILLVELFRNKPNAIANAGVTLLGVLYLSLFSFFILLRNYPSQEFGRKILFLIIIGIWICDTAAYFVGITIGKFRLFPRVSPKKTWEGAIAGFLTSILFAVFFQHAWLPMLNWKKGVILGILIGVFSQLGDLVESLFKRDAEVKDASGLFPGHGGMLDRFDSPLIVGPVVYLYLVWFCF